MNTNQPKYITYKGTRYQRVDSINEIEVRNIPPTKVKWCIVEVVVSYGDQYVGDKKIYTSHTYFLSIEDVLKYVKNSYEIDDEDFSPRKLDDYTYCGGLNEEVFYIVCTRNKGVGKTVYDLVEESSDDDRLIREVFNTIEGVLGPYEDWDF